MAKRTTTKGQKKTCQQTNFLHHLSRNRPTILTECVVLFCELLFVLFSPFICIVCHSSTYGFWLSLWYLQTFLSHFELLLKNHGPELDQTWMWYDLGWSSSKLCPVTLPYIQDGCGCFWLVENGNMLKIFFLRTTWWNETFNTQRPCGVVSFHNGVHWLRQVSKIATSDNNATW
jgi:hypothetical protein